jgi:hypothetical protein
MATDIFELLGEQQLPEPAQATLPVISLWGEGKYNLMFFTFASEAFKSHYDEAQKSYLCNGPDCPACAVGVKATEHVYLPVWDVTKRRVAVLKFISRLDDGPAPKVMRFLKKYRERLHSIVAVVSCRGHGEFTIDAHEVGPDADPGARVCEEFCEKLKTGEIALRSCVKRLADEEIRALQSIRHQAGLAAGSVVGAKLTASGNSAQTQSSTVKGG